MKRPKYRGDHEQARPPQASQNMIAILIISFFIAAVLIGSILLICYSGKLAGDKGKISSPVAMPRVSSSPLGGDDLVSGKNPREVKGMDKPTHASVTTLPLDEPLEGGGTAESNSSTERGMETVTNPPAAPQERDRPAIEVMQNAVVGAQKARERQAKIDAITSYMVQYHGAPGLIALAPLMVDTATATGMDCRMAPCTAAAESTCGSDPNAHGNLFGCQGGNSNSWPAQIVWYYNRIAFLNSQHGWNNNWQIAYFWYGGGSPYGAGGVGSSAGYADNVIRDVESIGW